MSYIPELLNPKSPGRPGECLYWGQLYGASASLALAAAAQTRSGPVVVVTPDMQTAARLEHELRFFIGEHSPLLLLIFPDWETLPYDNFSPHEDIISQRLQTLYRLPHLRQGILLVPVTTLMQRIPPRDYLDANSFVLACKEQLDLSAFRRRLEASGYRFVSQVMGHGEFAIRGSIIDLFPMGSKFPFRIDLFGDEVDTVRSFNPETQRSLETFDSINLLPAREFPLDEAAISRFRQNWRTKFTGNPMNSAVYENISQGQSATGVEYYLPLFFEHTVTLFDYLPENCLIARMQEVEPAAAKFWTEINERYEQLRHDYTRPLLPPADIFLTVDQVFAATKNFPQLQIQQAALPEKPININFATEVLPDLTTDRKLEQPLTKLKNYLAQTKSRVLFCAETMGRRESLRELLQSIQITPQEVYSWQEFLQTKKPIAMTVALLEAGCV